MADTAQKIDRLTIVGLGLLLMPLLTMCHEIGGHAAACVALGHRVMELGAFYVQCDAPRGTAAMRIVAVAGAGVDLLAGALVWLAWERLKSDLARLAGWYIALCLLFDGTGYLLFSGVAGVGDLAPEGDGGLAPLSHPLLWRAGLAMVGFVAYFALVRAGMGRLAAMIGQGPETEGVRRRIAHLFYAVVGAAALLASIPNPVGAFITLASAGAASLGGKAGLISIGFATKPEGAPLPFAIGRNWLVIGAGLVASLAFAVVLGPTLKFG